MCEKMVLPVRIIAWGRGMSKKLLEFSGDLYMIDMALPSEGWFGALTEVGMKPVGRGGCEGW